MGEDVCAPAVCGAGVWYAVGRYNIRESIIGNLFVILLSILREGDRRTGNLPPAEVLPKERLAQRLRYCRIMPMKRRNAPPRTAGQGLHAPWTAHINYIFLLVLCQFICLRLTVVLHCRIHICIRILRLSKNGITRSNLAHSYLITITDVFLLDSKHTC